MSDSVSWLAISCTHSPLHDDDAVDWALGECENRQPDVVIHLGDFLEAKAASRWPDEDIIALEDEYVAANDLLRSFRKVTPHAKHILLEGNHDANILAINRIPQELRGLVNYKRHIQEIYEGHWRMPCDYIYHREKGTYRIGQVTFAHGYKAGQTADKLQCPRLAMPFGLLVLGHTHRPKQVTQYQTSQSQVPGWYDPWYANPGALRDIDNVDYMTRKDRSGWGQGIVVGESHSWRYDQHYYPQYRAWNAETIVRRMYE